MISLSMCFLALAVFAAALPSPVCWRLARPLLLRETLSLQHNALPLPDCATDSHCGLRGDETHSRQVPLQGSPDEIRPAHPVRPCSTLLPRPPLNLSASAAHFPELHLPQWCTVRLLV